MARKPRIQYPGAFCHVIACGNGGQKIFRDSQDCERYLVPIYQYLIMFAEFSSKKIFSPPRHQDTKLKYNKQFFFVPLWLFFPVYLG